MTAIRTRKSNRREPKPSTVGVNCNRFVLRPGRLITVNGVRWKWKCGKGCGVIAYSELGQRAYAQAWEIKGCTPGRIRARTVEANGRRNADAERSGKMAR